MVLNRFGQIVQQSWVNLEEHFYSVELDYHVIMPNHIHGIIFINSGEKRLINQTPTSNPDKWILMKNSELILGKIVRYFKARTSKELRVARLSKFR